MVNVNVLESKKKNKNLLRTKFKMGKKSPRNIDVDTRREVQATKVRPCLHLPSKHSSSFVSNVHYGGGASQKRNQICAIAITSAFVCFFLLSILIGPFSL